MESIKRTFTDKNTTPSALDNVSDKNITPSALSLHAKGNRAVKIRDEDLIELDR